MAWAVVSAKYYFLEKLSAQSTGVARSRSSLRPSKHLGRFFAEENPHRNISPLAPRANTPGAYLRVFAMNRRIDRAMDDDPTSGWREAAYCLVHEVKPLKPSGHSPPRPSMFRRMKELKMRNTSNAQAFKKVGGENPVSKVHHFC